MNPTQQALWEKILHFELNDPQAPFPFVQRLALENGWKLDFRLPGHPGIQTIHVPLLCGT